jgi:hypothetical protein
MRKRGITIHMSVHYPIRFGIKRARAAVPAGARDGWPPRTDGEPEIDRLVRGLRDLVDERGQDLEEIDIRPLPSRPERVVAGV